MGEENNKKNRHFILSDDVTQSSVVNIIKEIREINRHDDEQEEKVVDYERKPIEILVNTFGGSVYDGFGLVAEIEMSKTPIHTICNGKAMSMGFIIVAAGHKRFMNYPFATLMYHQISTFEWNDITHIKRSVEEAERLEKIYDDYVLRRTNLMRSQLDEIKEKRMNWYVDAQDAKKLGIIDEVIS